VRASPLPVSILEDLMSLRSNLPAGRSSLSLEPLECRLTPATTANFLGGLLVVSGDPMDNNIVVAANNDGTISVTDNGQAVAIRSLRGAATLDGLRLIVVNGRAGNDIITVDQSIGNVPAVLSGDGGDDTLNANHNGNSVLLGGAGNDILNGGGGFDALFGGDGTDTVNGGGNADFLSGGAGDDSLNGGDGRDLLFGDAGNDTLDGGADGSADLLIGGPGADTFVADNGDNDVILDLDPDEGDTVV